MTTSLIIPAYDEEEALPHVLDEVMGMVDEVIVVDDGSTDGTSSCARKDGITVYQHDVNRGKVAAIRTGVGHAMGDIVVLMDADHTYPAEHIPQMLASIEQGADLVLGSRFMGRSKAMPFLNRVGNRIFSFIISYVGATTITDGQTGYRAFRREMFEKLDVKATGLEWETKMTVRAQKLGYTIKEIPITYRPRIGKSKLNPLRDGLHMFIALASIFVRETSLLAGSIILPSALLGLIGLVFGLISLYEKFTYLTLRHEYFPLIATLFILLSIQLFSLGFLLDHLIKRLDRIEERLKER